ncbi:MAG: hypothetical protein ACRCWD_02330 [Culicoidibacterales bacterium]
MIQKKYVSIVFLFFTLLSFFILITFSFFQWKLPQLSTPKADDFMSSELFYLAETSNGLYSSRTYTTLTTTSETTFTGDIHPFIPNYNLAFFDSYNDDLIWGSLGNPHINIDGQEQSLPAGLETIFFTGNWRIAQTFAQDTTTFVNLDNHQDISLPGQFTHLQVDNFVYLMLTNPIHENPLYRLNLQTLELKKVADFPTTITQTHLLFSGDIIFYLDKQTMYQVDQYGTVSTVRSNSELFDLLNDSTITPLINKNNAVSSVYLVTNSKNIKLLKLYPNATYSLETIPNLVIPSDMNILLKDVVIDPVSQDATILLTAGDEAQLVPYVLTMNGTTLISQHYWSTASQNTLSPNMKIVRINKMN